MNEKQLDDLSDKLFELDTQIREIELFFDGLEGIDEQRYPEQFELLDQMRGKLLELCGKHGIQF